MGQIYEVELLSQLSIQTWIQRASLPFNSKASLSVRGKLRRDASSITSSFVSGCGVVPNFVLLVCSRLWCVRTR